MNETDRKVQVTLDDKTGAITIKSPDFSITCNPKGYSVTQVNVPNGIHVTVSREPDWKKIDTVLRKRENLNK